MNNKILEFLRFIWPVIVIVVLILCVLVFIPSKMSERILIKKGVDAKIQEVELGAGVVQVFTYDGKIYRLADYSSGAYVPATKIIFDVLMRRGIYEFDVKFYLMKESGDDKGKSD